jgi:serine/threonine protein phosphatase PrpC
MFENVRYGVKSDVGLRRCDNEDHFLIVASSGNGHNLKQLGIAFVIADGIGGHAAGEIASRTACEEVVAAYYRDDVLFPDQADAEAGKVRKLEQATRMAHNKIIRLAAEREEWRGMGTTLSVLVLTENKALIVHVGDSRIYRCRSSASERMTIDHTKSQALIDLGKILPEEEKNPCCGHILTRALGGYDDLEAVFTRVEQVRKGDVFLLCTDGLHDLVTDSEIEAILINNSRPQAACDELVHAAIRKGGADNITVIVIQVK